MIYLDNAATTLKKPAAVKEALINAIDHMTNANRGAGGPSLEASRTIFMARLALNQLINGTDPRQIALTFNATHALNIAIKGLITPGDHVITTVMEHNSVLRPLYALQKSGVELTILDMNDAGIISPEAVQAAIRPHTKAIVINHASNVTGNVNPIQEILAVTAPRGIVSIVDASQTMGILPIDVQALPVDVLCFTGHKALFGPQGTGGLYVKEGVTVQPLLVGGTGSNSHLKTQPNHMPTQLEAGTMNGHGIAGLAAGVNFILETGIERIAQREQELLTYFLTGLADIEGLTLYGNYDLSQPHTGIVALNVKDFDSGQVADQLEAEYQIVTRAGAHCAPLMHEALGTMDQGLVRFSLSYFTTEAELDQAIHALRELAQRDTLA